MLEFLTTPFNNYVNDMKTNGTYAYHFVIQAMRSTLGSAINIVHAEKEESLLLRPAESTNRAVLAVGYMEDVQHYVSLER
ncbi:hypothetical protein DPMN_044901 [Dreissena polymorpha]|uniref:Uncharacterized protein n=1 Tax=Dreissena polymorpha TaxID=45954 RepID=A0A9D4D416_DREPO|nr:hypothetical protein DPMN_044901 [Dreissena polymorpha]